MARAIHDVRYVLRLAVDRRFDAAKLDPIAEAAAEVERERAKAAQAPDSLDAQRARGFEAQTILRDLCEGLTTLDRHAGVAPGVATSWSVSPDSLTYTFALRHDARWSNGDQVVAWDFVAGLMRLVDPATASGIRRISSASAVEGIGSRVS